MSTTAVSTETRSRVTSTPLPTATSSLPPPLHLTDAQMRELESELQMTRFGVMKHLRVLEQAGLVVTRRQGREKLHFLNPVPIRLIHDRWIDKYTERRVSALADLKRQREQSARDRADESGQGED